MMILSGKRVLFFILVLFFPPWTSISGAPVSGEWSTLFCEFSSMDPSLLMQQDLRLEFRDSLLPGLELDYAAKMIMEASSPALPVKEIEYRLFARREEELIHGDGYRLLYDTSQLSVSAYSDGAEVIIGRQVIAWGASKITNPTDLFAPVSLRDFERDVRNGVDSIRLRIPTGMVSEVDLGAVAEKRGSSTGASVFGRVAFSLGKSDGSLLYVYTGEKHFTGADLTGYMGQAGFWLEGGIFWERETDKGTAGAMSAGIEGHLTPSLYAAMELLWAHSCYPIPSFREAGVENSKTASLLINLTRGLVTFYAKAVAGLEQREYIWLLQGDYNIKENTYAQIGSMIVKQEQSDRRSSFLALKIYF